MSDDDDGQAAGFFLFPSKAEIERAQEQYKMGHQAFYHEMLGFLQKQTDEDMLTLASLVRVATNNGEQLTGIIEGIMASRGFCFACGKRHDESIDQILDEAEPKREPTGPGNSIVSIDQPVSVVAFDASTMNEYNVEPFGELSKVRCKGCGMIYESMEDRMLRRPSACHGCQHKAKWG